MQTKDAPAARVDVHLTPDDLRHALRSDAERGLRTDPKDIPPKWFYDDRGSQLFDDITRLPEYYPTRRERAILEARAHEIARITRADTLVELGSGTSDKTRILLDAVTSPSMGSSCAASRRARVVLPLPLRPRSAMRSSGSTRRFRRRRTGMSA